MSARRTPLRHTAALWAASGLLASGAACTSLLGDFSTSVKGADGGVGGGDDASGEATAAEGAAPDSSGGTDSGEAGAANCALTSSCPPGTPCTSDTQCASTSCTPAGRCAAPQCAASASCGLGAACQNGGACASGNCVDGVCCETASCPACTNCGSTGMCNVVVSGQDDLTAKTCTGNFTCAGDGGCTQRWVQVGTTNAITIPQGEYAYTATAGDVFFFSAAPSADAMEGFDTKTLMFSSYPKDSSMCWCGGFPSIVGGVVSGTPYLFSLWDGQLDYYAVGGSAWGTLSAREPNGNSNSAIGLLGSTVYSISGNTTQSNAISWPQGSAWSTIAPVPGSGGTEGCTASDPTTGSIYLFGGSIGGMYVYSQSANSWTSIAAAGQSCYSQALSIWRGKIAYVPSFSNTTGVALFDIATSTWVKPLPLPAGTWQFASAFSANGDLYVLLYDGMNDTIFKWNLP